MRFGVPSMGFGGACQICFLGEIISNNEKEVTKKSDCKEIFFAIFFEGNLFFLVGGRRVRKIGKWRESLDGINSNFTSNILKKRVCKIPSNLPPAPSLTLLILPPTVVLSLFHSFFFIRNFQQSNKALQIAFIPYNWRFEYV